MTDTIDNLYEELVYLCEVRGELDPESNAKIEARIAAINAEIKELKNISSRRGKHESRSSRISRRKSSP